MKKNFARRDLLKGAGLGALMSSVPMLRGARAFAQTGVVPKRLLLIYGITGNLPTHPQKSTRSPGNWEPLAPQGMAEPNETAWELNTTLQPFAPFKKDMILFENLDDNQTLVDPTNPDSGHHAGGTTALTGDNRLSRELPGAISIDQFIARQLNMPAPVTRLLSLDIMAAQDDQPFNSEAFATGPGQVVPRLWDPPAVYARAFPDGVVSANPSDQQAAAARLSALRNREFDFLAAQGKLLHDRIGASDRMKIEQHLDTLGELRKRLGLMAMPVTKVDAIPPKTIYDEWKRTPHGYNELYSREAIPGQAQKVWDMNIDVNSLIAVSALHADVTRVASVLIGDCPDAGINSAKYGVLDGHDLEHKVNNAQLPFYTNPEARGDLSRAHTKVMAKVANIVDMLAKRTESDGSRLLDHTVVLYTSQIADGNHGLTNLPWLVFGSAGGYFKTGRYIRFPRTNKAFGMNTGRSHNDLFVSVANALGVAINSFGNAKVCTGPIAELRG